MSLRSALSPVAALLIGTALLYLGYGLQATLVPLRADSEGFSRVIIGILGATYYAGFVAGCLFAPFVILRSGHIRAFAAMVSCVSAAVLAFPLVVGEIEWVLFRFTIGFCISGILVVVESWLNDKATNETRGIVMSTYVIITYLTITAGQLGVATRPLDGFGLFSLCSIALSLAAVPVALTRSTQPAPIPVVRFNLRTLVSVAPAAFAGAFANGVMMGSLYSLGAIYAIDTGFTANEAAFFVSAAVLGGAVGQYPIGRMSDFVDRRIVLLVAVMVTAGFCLFLVFGEAMPQWMLLAFGFGIGSVLLPSYSLAAAHAYDWADSEQLVETSAGLILLYGIGSTIGPILASIVMVVVGPGGLFLVIGITAASLAAFIGLRIVSRSRPDEEMRTDFDIFSTAPVGNVITPEPLDESNPLVETPELWSPLPAEGTESEGTENEGDSTAATDEGVTTDPLPSDDGASDIDGNRIKEGS
ncbi:MFS transporter [Acuticoccus mangrovi]|uniref:MFS transporter n=1 Tax=Acuticoccus mangrovi TaxID=2796142 RepID=A0A934MGE7_9HYPH|nr:MFS transporter [Acuticoccus mangrovi]